MLGPGVTFLSAQALCRCCGVLRLLRLTFFSSRVLCRRCSVEVLQVDIFVSSRACTAAAVRGSREVTILSGGVTRRHRCGSFVCLASFLSPDTRTPASWCPVVPSRGCSSQGLIRGQAIPDRVAPGPGPVVAVHRWLTAYHRKNGAGAIGWTGEPC